MDYENLIETAKKIPAASPKALSEYEKKSDLLVASMNQHMISLPDLSSLIGKNSITQMKNNHANHVLFVHSILKNPNPVVLTDTLLWVIRTYSNQGFKPNYWKVQIEAWFEVFLNLLSAETFAEITPLYEWMQFNIPVLIQLSISNSIEK
jgi:hypothetical protein